MPTAFDMPSQEDMATGGNYLDEPGTYHLQITHVDEQPTSKGSTAIDGFRIELSVVEGPQKDKETDIIFFNPKQSSKDQGKWARNKQAAFLIAAGLVTEQQLGQRVEIDLKAAEGRQVIAELELGQADAKGKRFLELAWANIYHVDDPRVATAAKNAAALGLIPKSLRRDPASFATAKKDGAGSNGSATSPTSTTEISDDLGDL